jgi:hypothetical protein
MTNRLFIWLTALTLFSAGASAQLAAPVAPQRGRVVEDQQLVIRDRGAQLEILPGLRAVPEIHDGKTFHRIAMGGAGENFSKSRVGVAFNHRLQAYGVLTGEISVRLKPNAKASSIRVPGVPNARRLVVADIYVIQTRTPAEFVQVYKSLQTNSAVEWTEPFVIYGKVIQ